METLRETRTRQILIDLKNIIRVYSENMHIICENVHNRNMQPCKAHKQAKAINTRYTIVSDRIEKIINANKGVFTGDYQPLYDMVSSAEESYNTYYSYLFD